MEDDMSNKYGYPKSDFKAWKDKILHMVNLKIDKVKESVTIKGTAPVLSNPAALENLSRLQEKYVIVPIDKAAKSFAFVCKKFYISKLLADMKFLEGNSPTYRKKFSSQETLCFQKHRILLKIRLYNC